MSGGPRAGRPRGSRPRSSGPGRASLCGARPPRVVVHAAAVLDEEVLVEELADAVAEALADAGLLDGALLEGGLPAAGGGTGLPVVQLNALGETEQRVYAALSAVEAAGDATHVEAVAHQAELSPDEAREALQVLERESLVAQLPGAADAAGGAGSADLGPTYTVKDRG